MDGRKTLVLVGIVALMGAAALAQDDAQAAVEETTATFVEAYNAENYEAVTDLFVDDAWLGETDGSEAEGRDAILETFSQPDPMLEGTTLEATDTEVVSLAEGAVARGEYAYRADDGTAVVEGNFMAYHVMQDGEWRIRWLLINMVQPQMPMQDPAAGDGAAGAAQQDDAAGQDGAAQDGAAQDGAAQDDGAAEDAPAEEGADDAADDGM